MSFAIFVRSGYPAMGYDVLRGAGFRGDYSSCSGATLDNTYRLHFNDLGISSSHGPFARYDAFSLRCLRE